MKRRAFLAAGVGATAGLAGCRSVFETRSARSPPLAEDRPDAVYYPSHTAGMETVGVTEAGDYAVALTYSFPHRFWLVDGDRTNQVAVEGEDALHLMAVVWDGETETVVPHSSVRATLRRDGAVVAERRLWEMLSQNMGVHAGDNLAVEDGTYEVTLDVPPVSTRRTGAFADRLGEGGTATFDLEVSRSAVEELTFQRLPSEQGDRGAVEPMDMDAVPTTRLPPAEALPGDLLGTAVSGDARFAALRLASPPAGVDAEGSAYLAVSAQTPYNRYPLPMLSLSATLDRGGTTAFDGALVPTFDPDLGYHYGAVADPRSGDALSIRVDAPSQMARHEGYETAFLSFEETTVEV